MRSFHQDQLEEGAGISCCCLRGGKGIRKDADVLQVNTTLQLYEVFFLFGWERKSSCTSQATCVLQRTGCKGGTQYRGSEHHED